MTSNDNDRATPGHVVRRWTLRAICIVLSLFAILVSMGATGIGWTLAALALATAGLCLPVIGSAWFGVCLAILLFHMVAIGPLHGIESIAGAYRRDALVAAIVPLALGLAAALAQAWRHR